MIRDRERVAEKEAAAAGVKAQKDNTATKQVEKEQKALAKAIPEVSVAKGKKTIKDRAKKQPEVVILEKGGPIVVTNRIPSPTTWFCCLVRYLGVAAPSTGLLSCT